MNVGYSLCRLTRAMWGFTQARIATHSNGAIHEVLMSSAEPYDTVPCRPAHNRES